MIAQVVVAALAFSAPPSLTRREMAVGFGAAAAAMVSSPAFAKVLTKEEKAAQLAADLAALDAGAKIKKQDEQSSNPGQPSYYNPNGVNVLAVKDTGVTMRKPLDPKLLKSY